ncbi:MAG: hypothetical protein KF778_01905 [Rhodocyclaceae bacterium]|nr:hypothetical protein [Rhodocyclaceae bacterium]MBX3667129.1 hypothetical protein [Rhodocyclaceae bacterium]
MPDFHGQAVLSAEAGQRRQGRAQLVGSKFQPLADGLRLADDGGNRNAFARGRGDDVPRDTMLEPTFPS